MESSKQLDPNVKKWVYELYKHGRLTRGERVEALSMLCGERDHTLQVLMNFLTLVGVGLCLTAIFFFFAYYPDISSKIEFMVIELGLIVSVLGALALGLDVFFGKILMFVASMLVGLLLAHLGQVYQLGADSYVLFATWALMIFPWVWFSRNVYQWGLLLGLVSIALNLFSFSQTFSTFFSFLGTWVPGMFLLFLMLVYASFLVMAERYKSSVDWLKSNSSFMTSLQGLLLLFMWKPLSNLMREEIVSFSGVVSMVAVSILIIYYLFYRYREKNIIALSMFVLFCCTVLMDWVSLHRLQENYLIPVVIYASGAFLIQVLHKKIKELS
ncbi:MAG TPA: DUF2157 domain-containing protein [Gammaproteobacteria bacterium]|nr:DUF2157 domain-containing protein [Gammaproteobacteria bacterium]